MSSKIDGVPRDLIEDALAIATTHATATWSAGVRDRLRILLDGSERKPVSIPRISGMGRDADHQKALVLYLGNVPTDDDIRAIQEALRAPPELAELQATIANLDSNLFRQSERIAQLTAENERLKGGQGEPVALFESVIGKNPEAFLHEPVYQVTESEVREFASLLASQPAPVSVVLPPYRVSIPAGLESHSDKQWNACLDKVKELNQ